MVFQESYYRSLRVHLGQYRHGFGLPAVMGGLHKIPEIVVRYHHCSRSLFVFAQVILIEKFLK